MTGGQPAKRYETCGAKKRQGEGTCTRPAGWGTDHPGVGRCKLHGGSTPSQKRKAEVEIIRRAAASLGIVPDEHVDPVEQMLELVSEAARNCEFYRQLVSQLPTHPEPDKFVAGHTDDDGVDIEPHWERGEIGVYGRTYHQSGIPTGEAKTHILVQMYDDERDRLASYITAALKAGVEERRVRLAERDATMLFAAVGLALDRMGLSKRFEEFRVEFARALDEQPAALGAARAR
jgi:hypothetical protein